MMSTVLLFLNTLTLLNKQINKFIYQQLHQHSPTT